MLSPPAPVPCQNGLMPLHKAAENGHMEVVKILLAAGASKDIASKVSLWLAALKEGETGLSEGVMAVVASNISDQQLAEEYVVMVAIDGLPSSRGSVGVNGCSGMYVCCLAGFCL